MEDFEQRAAAPLGYAAPRSNKRGSAIEPFVAAVLTIFATLAAATCLNSVFFEAWRGWVNRSLIAVVALLAIGAAAGGARLTHRSWKLYVGRNVLDWAETNERDPP